MTLKSTLPGNNHIHLNEATMCEALQEYFDKRTAPGFVHPKVTSVSWISGGQVFVVYVKAEEKK